MTDLCTYRFTLRGQVDVLEINATSPLRMSVEQANADRTQLVVCTDQSGLIGLMRHLHGLGYVLLAVVCEA